MRKRIISGAIGLAVAALCGLGVSASPPDEKPKEGLAPQTLPGVQPEPRPKAPTAPGEKGGSFVTKPEPVGEPAAATPLTKEEQTRYDAVAAALVKAMNAEDRKAYRALHTDEAWESTIDWWRDMFAAQRAKFGPIVLAYPCTRETLRFGKMGFRGEGTTFVAIFEEKVGGAFSFEINADNKITSTSVFIKEEMASYDGGGAKPIYERK